MFKIVKLEQHARHVDDKDYERDTDNPPCPCDVGYFIIFIWPVKETVVDNLYNRRSRPIDAWEKEVLPQVQAQIPELKDARFVWNQRAGCNCGCSPGFVIHNAPNYKMDIHIDVMEEP